MLKRDIMKDKLNNIFLILEKEILKKIFWLNLFFF